MRSRVAALGFFGLGAGLGVNVVGFGVKVVELGWVVVELAGLTAGLGAGLMAGLGAGLTAGLGAGLTAGELVGLGEVSDSEAMALDVLPLITPKIPPATSARANMAITGMSKRGSFTLGVYVMKHPKRCSQSPQLPGHVRIVGCAREISTEEIPRDTHGSAKQPRCFFSLY